MEAVDNRRTGTPFTVSLSPQAVPTHWHLSVTGTGELLAEGRLPVDKARVRAACDIWRAGQREIRLAHCRIAWTPDGCVTQFADGTDIGAQPHDIPHYHVIAHRCGYGGDLLAYCREHEFAHAFMAERFGDGISPVLWGLAHGCPISGPASVQEELAAQAFQRWLRAAERPIAGGADWDALKRDALAMLERANAPEIYP